MRRAWIGCTVIGLMGCAATSSLTPVPPMASDIGHWSQPGIVEEAPELTTPHVVTRPKRRSEKVVPFELGTEVPVDVMVGKPLRIELKAGEQIANVVDGYRGVLQVGDETPPWDVTETRSGSQQQPHVIVTATKSGLINGITITTTEHVYEVVCRSVERSAIRVLRWEYPEVVEPKKPPVRILPDPLMASSYHVGYTVHASEPLPVWMPVRPVLDNGRQTFITLPPNLGSMQAPMVRLLGPNGPELVNARLYRSVLILDHQFDAAELRYGTGEHAQIVRIVRGPSETIDCPVDPRCPRWPSQTVLTHRMK